MLQKFLRDQRGAILAEYALLAVLIAVACVVAVIALGTSVLGLYTSGGLLGAL
jgi:Flp pilus assembly pilin Flp